MAMPNIQGACADFNDALRVTRRRALELGGLGALELALPTLLRGRALASSPSAGGLGGRDAAGTSGTMPGFGRAKQCILIFQWGGPSQIDTWDPKPDAPDEVRGEFKPISTSVPGIAISEHFPRLARLADRYAIIRSLTHDDPAHLSSAHHILTGHYARKRFSDADPPSHDDWPHVGSVLAKLRPGTGSVPSFVSLPWTVSHPAAPGGRAPGQNAGWLGPMLDPMTIGDPSQADFSVAGCELPSDLSADRMKARRQLLAQADRLGIAAAPAAGATDEWSGLTTRAFDLLCGSASQRAFRLEAESTQVRDRYGRHTHGQCLLMARRLLEAGVGLVTVNWHNDGQNFWDTHGQNFRQLRDRLMPPADQGFSALLEDLEDRGMLDETLIIWVGEFGRRPHIDRAHAGRDHWPRCFSGVLAGGGVRGGQVYGKSDRFAAFPRENPVAPDDLVATVFHSLGIPAAVAIHDRQNVPKQVYTGQVLEALF